MPPRVGRPVARRRGAASLGEQGLGGGCSWDPEPQPAQPGGTPRSCAGACETVQPGGQGRASVFRPRTGLHLEPTSPCPARPKISL